MSDGQGTQVESAPGRLSDHLSLGVIARVYRRDVIDEIVLRSGRREKRERLLPARLVLYFVIALGLFFGDAYEEVMAKMVGGLKFVSAWEKAWKLPTASALCQARKRLGEAPVKELFDQVCQPLATSPAQTELWRHSRWSASSSTPKPTSPPSRCTATSTTPDYGSSPAAERSTPPSTATNPTSSSTPHWYPHSTPEDGRKLALGLPLSGGGMSPSHRPQEPHAGDSVLISAAMFTLANPVEPFA